MEGCIFCKIVAGEIPCYKIWEDENFLAFLDIKPVEAGHTLLIPKKHFRWVWDLPAGRQEIGNYSEYFEKVREVALILKEKLGAEWVQMNVLGIDIPHSHVHLVPHNLKVQLHKEKFEDILHALEVKP